MENTPFHIAITKEQLSKLPPVEFAGAITVVSEPEDVAAAVEFLRSQDVVGFDTETKPNFKKGMTNTVSLIQVSTEDHSYLFQIGRAHV